MIDSVWPEVFDSFFYITYLYYCPLPVFYYIFCSKSSFTRTCMGDTKLKLVKNRFYKKLRYWTNNNRSSLLWGCVYLTFTDIFFTGKCLQVWGDCKKTIFCLNQKTQYNVSAHSNLYSLVSWKNLITGKKNVWYKMNKTWGSRVIGYNQQ